MFKQDLVDYLEGKISPDELNKLVEIELKSYKELLSQKRSSIPVKLDGDKSLLIIVSGFLNRLNSDFLNHRIDWYFRSYLADSLLLSENSLFESEELKDEFEALTES